MKIVETLYDRFMNLIATLIAKDSKGGVNILELEWDHLIVLDACRCDIFAKVYTYFFPKEVQFKCIYSTASSTMEFIRNNILKSPATVKKLKDVVFVNANPVIDNVLGSSVHKIFHKYIPVWRRYWNENLGTVEPKYTYLVALRTIIKHPNKRMMIWFLQPHYPYIDKRFQHINALGRGFMNKAIQNSHDNKLMTLFKIFTTLMRRRYLCAGIPEKVCRYMDQARLEIIKAYMYNMIIVLRYIQELTKILPGRIAITSDHGEAFGEPLDKLTLIRVYGHPSRTKVPALTNVPYLEIPNSISLRMAIKKTLSSLLKSDIANRVRR